jgi:ferredoxin-NADP reductase/nitrite reductase/ring-hydroxylating ferredoxin subunit
MMGSSLADVADVPAQGAGGLQIDADGVPVGLFRVGEEIVAWRSVCPHAAAPVCAGRVDGTRVPSAVYEYRYGRDREILQCPWHGWEFDLVTGEHLAEGSSARMRRHPVRVADGRVYNAAPSQRVDLAVTVTEVVQETAEVVVLALSAERLPAWTPGAHLEIELPSGLLRHYSLCGDPRDRTTYRIAVLREEGGRGGSAELHRASVGLELRITAIRNRFPLRLAKHHLLIAGGIGITALLPMLRMLRATRRSFQLIYTGRDRSSMAFVDDLATISGTRIVESRRSGRIDLRKLVADVPAGTAIHACGPDTLLDELRDAVAASARPLELFTEAFQVVGAPSRRDDDAAFEVQVGGEHLTVRADASILTTLRAAGHLVPSSCESGWCGSCETRVTDGVPDHRDTVLSDGERASGQTMMICVSRSHSGVLALDI